MLDIPAENEATEFDIWPENQQTVTVFTRACTQWNSLIAPSGAVLVRGLNYAALPALLTACNIPAPLHSDVLTGVQVMEMAALPLLNRA